MKKDPQELDEMDKRLLQELIKNSKRSYRKLAKELRVAPATVIDRVRALEKDGYITGYGSRLNYTKLGFEFMALAEISISGRDLLSVEDKISKLDNVAAVYDITGQYDAMAIIMCKTRAELSTTVKKILALPGVEKTNTNIVLNVLKRLTEFDKV